MTQNQETLDNFLDSVRDNMATGDRHEGGGMALQPLSQSEENAIRDFFTTLKKHKHGLDGFHYTMELGPTDRKMVIAFFVIFPLISTMAEEQGKNLVYITNTSELESRARNHIRWYGIIQSLPTCCTWDDLASGGNIIANSCFVVGDLDWEGSPPNAHEFIQKINSGISKVRKAKNSFVLFMHQSGNTPAIDPAKASKAPGLWG